MNRSSCSIKACPCRSQRTPFIGYTCRKAAISATVMAALESESAAPESKGQGTSRLIWSPPCCDPIHRMSGSQHQGSVCRLCFLSLKGTWWLNYKERCSEAAEVSCVAAGPHNENLAWKDKCVVAEQMVWVWVFFFRSQGLKMRTCFYFGGRPYGMF